MEFCHTLSVNWQTKKKKLDVETFQIIRLPQSARSESDTSENNRYLMRLLFSSQDAIASKQTLVRPTVQRRIVEAHAFQECQFPSSLKIEPAFWKKKTWIRFRHKTAMIDWQEYLRTAERGLARQCTTKAMNTEAAHAHTVYMARWT